MSAMGRKRSWSLASGADEPDIRLTEDFAVLQRRSCACCSGRSRQHGGSTRLHLLSRPRRPRRSHEWSAGKAVTFIVTLAATRSVTLAAREARMSRKSAYALKARDPAFAAAWNAAVKAGKGDKADKPDRPPVPVAEGRKPARAELSNSAPAHGRPVRLAADHHRDLFFSRLACSAGTRRPAA
jgi:hypothetical protein